MDRINIKCLIAGLETELQFDKKAMPGEAGPCFMITESGCFKGYISRKRDGAYQPIGALYYTDTDFKLIGEVLGQKVR
ncbi:hypothetical protein DIU31_009310 [Mucilaginibacter rubeus]|uniref:Uncharacterized protein n=1 Tax=Mucilaginibacter rubeus TaxID=2027860 RepID=A0AAE6JDS5_9SPHI|nr:MULTISPECIES: hypothetical protein [Mucilaginibacter]QEM03701.1 hypothetical protein DIU31_009310 [Mucilaginibacter rubeus]QEM16312.1 hypothetical protein DIU38_009405 [Mucilaginibacter gossypii]QTE40925.1 hypothetical protein J3L19_18360 [Mucilaginibacter rubeus]QTE47528.1 hypothetical protein J3L21_18335 [Mucilaginibacter rubeus]QTE58920.1 hypothetical protein J3L23_10000 [Mucilaginibacter rubeus]